LLIGCIIKKLVTMSTIDFVSLVEKNPLTQLSGTYQYHPIHDFAIDLDNVWKWIGFCQKAMAKRLLETFFVIKIGRFTTIPDHMYQEFGMGGGLGLD